MSYKDTLHLPKTDFPMKAQLPVREPEMLEKWSKMDIYGQLRKDRKDRETFILHDGPPYANGHIHVGHAQNKTNKDVINRFHNMNGENVLYVPGWDCHGLPIEWKVEEKYRKAKKDKDDVPVLEFRQECRDFADHWVEVQKAEFQRMGVMGDWDNPYLTMTHDAEAVIFQELSKFVMDGSLYQQLRPVLWSPVEQTALAEAETEYQDKTSTTVYVGFPVVTAAFPELQGAHIVIWTTTPWTLPANRGIAFGTDIDYVLVEVTEVEEDSLATKGQKLVFAESLLAEGLGTSRITGHSVLKHFKGTELTGTVCAHPLRGQGFDYDVPLHAAPFVTTEQGSGLVHMAPGYGMDEFQLNRDENLGMEVAEILNDDGTYRANVPLFAGQHVFKADAPVCEAIQETGCLIGKDKLVHAYPHSWRSKAPLIYRATPQWFISMETTKIREKALSAIKDTRWVPERGENRIRAMVEDRPDWCISRQRTWGVPIAIFVHKETGEVLRDQAVLDRIVAAFRDQGADAWYKADPQTFLGDQYKADDYKQITDVVDVWFESGCTHAFVLEERADHSWPADVYLEGSDQHRGWFQSSLLESCGTRGRAPYGTVVTHGFVNDEKGRKMSKSQGNVVSPIDISNEMGADIFRLWAISVDWTDDMRIGNELLKQVGENYRRFRNTLRYILGNLTGFEAAEKVDYADLPELEKWVLHRLTQLEAARKAAIEDYQFTSWINDVYMFCHQDLSAMYFDIRKDALYCDHSDDLRRRSARTVLDILHTCLTRWLAPVLVFTAEEAYLARAENPDTDSVHLQEFPKIPAEWASPELADKWAQLFKLRRAVNGALEIERAAKNIAGSLQAKVDVYVSSDMAAWAKDVDLAELTVTSAVALHTNEPPETAFALPDVKGVAAVVAKADGDKCERCWVISPEVGQSTAHPNLCKRCCSVMDRTPTPDTAAA